MGWVFRVPVPSRPLWDGFSLTVNGFDFFSKLGTSSSIIMFRPALSRLYLKNI